MVSRCGVPGCKNTSQKLNISFHSFPKNEERRKAWCLRTKRNGSVSNSLKVCSAHFRPEDFKVLPCSRRLKDDAVPSIFSYEVPQEIEVPSDSPFSMPKCKKVKLTCESQDTVPSFEDFLEVPLENITSKKMTNTYCHKEKNLTKLFPLQEKKKNQANPNIFSKTKTSKYLHVPSNKTRFVCDPKTRTQLKQNKKIKKTFIKYFANGMSPAIAIQHHSSMLSVLNPGQLNSYKTNPPNAWVYELYDSWSKQKEEMLSDECKIFNITGQYNKTVSCGEKITPNNIKPLPVQTNVLIPCESKAGPDDDQETPRITHVNNDIDENYEDLKYLQIPDEVKEVFYKYFDDGLDVSEAMKLNEEDLKRDKNRPQFNPSKRVVIYLYKNWQEQTNSCGNWSSDSGLASFNETPEYNSAFKDLCDQTEYQNMDNFTINSTLRICPGLNSTTVIPHAKANHVPSSDSTMVALSSPCISTNSSSNSLSYVKKKYVLCKAVKDSFSQMVENLCFSNPLTTFVENYNVISQVEKNVISQTEEKTCSSNSSTFAEKYNLDSDVVKNSPSQTQEELCSSDTSKLENSDVISEVERTVTSLTEEKTCSPNSSTLTEKYNLESDVVKNSPSQTQEKLHSSNSLKLVENSDVVSEVEKYVTSQTEEKTCSSNSSTFAELDFDVLENSFSESEEQLYFLYPLQLVENYNMISEVRENVILETNVETCTSVSSTFFEKYNLDSNVVKNTSQIEGKLHSSNPLTNIKNRNEVIEIQKNPPSKTEERCSSKTEEKGCSSNSSTSVENCNLNYDVMKNSSQTEKKLDSSNPLKLVKNYVISEVEKTVSSQTEEKTCSSNSSTFAEKYTLDSDVVKNSPSQTQEKLHSSNTSKLENSDVIFGVERTVTSQTEEKTCSPNSSTLTEKYNLELNVVKNSPSHTQEKLHSSNSLKLVENSDVVSEVEKNVTSQTEEKACSSNSPIFVELYNLDSGVVKSLPSLTEEELFSSNSLTLGENYNAVTEIRKNLSSETEEKNYSYYSLTFTKNYNVVSGVVENPSLQIKEELCSSNTFVKNHTVVPEVGKNLPSQTGELCENMPNFVRVSYISDDHFITTSAQNYTTDLVDLSAVPVNSSNIKMNLCNNQISEVSVMTETETFNSMNDSSVLFSEKECQETSNLNKPYSDLSNECSFQTCSESSGHTSQTTLSHSLNGPINGSDGQSNHCGSDPDTFLSITEHVCSDCFKLNSENIRSEHIPYPFPKKCLRCTSTSSEIKELSQNFPTTQDSRINNVFLSSSSTSINGCATDQAIPNKLKMNDFMESKGFYLAPSYVNLVNNAIAMSLEDEEYEQSVGIRETRNLKIVPLELSKQNECEEFFRSLLPEFESLENVSKDMFKNDVRNSLQSAKLLQNQ